MIRPARFSFWNSLHKGALATLMAAAFVCMHHAAPAQEALIPNSAVKADKVGQKVTVQGRITNITPPRNERSPYAIFISDDTEALRIVIFPDIYKTIQNAEQFAVGARVKVTGEVKEYRGNIEIHLPDAASLQLYEGPAAVSEPAMTTAQPAAAPAVTSAAAAPAVAAAPPSEPPVLNVPAPSDLVAIKSIAAADDNKSVSIRGKVSSVRPSSRENVPTIVNVKDDSGAIDVVFWDDIGSQIPASNKPIMGADMQFSGTVNLFRDKPQIKLTKAGDAIRLSPAAAAPAGAGAGSSAATAAPAAADPAPSAALAGVTFTPAAKIEKAMLGQPIAVQGKITRVINVNGGKLVEVTDDSGKIMVPCWENTVGTSPHFDALKDGATIAVQGKVDFYEQRQQVQVKLESAAGLLSVQ